MSGKTRRRQGIYPSQSVYISLGLLSGKCTRNVDVVPLGYASLHLGFSPDFGYWGEKKSLFLGRFSFFERQPQKCEWGSLKDRTDDFFNHNWGEKKSLFLGRFSFFESQPQKWIWGHSKIEQTISLTIIGEEKVYFWVDFHFLRDSLKSGNGGHSKIEQIWKQVRCLWKQMRCLVETGAVSIRTLYLRNP